MKLLFKLDMPNRGSWNGRWSGEDNFYAITKTFTTKAGKEKAKEILEKGSFYYSWPDGWGASVSVRQLKKGERIKSDGFCGYDWMVSSIIEKGYIE